MITVSVRLEGMEELKNIPNIIKEIIKNIASEAETHMKTEAPYKSGALRGSIKYALSDGGMSAKISPSVKYAAAQNYGLPGGPGRFVPELGVRLLPSGRGWWPGFEGKHFVEATAEHIETVGQSIIEAILNKHLGGK